MLSVMDRCHLCKPRKNGSVSALTIEIKYLNYVPQRCPLRGEAISSRQENLECSSSNSTTGLPGRTPLQRSRRSGPALKQSRQLLLKRLPSMPSDSPSIFRGDQDGDASGCQRRSRRPAPRLSVRRRWLAARLSLEAVAKVWLGRPATLRQGRSFASLSTAVEGTTVSVRSARSGAQPGVLPAVGRGGCTSLLTRGRLALRLAVAGERGVSVMRGRDEHL